MTEFSEPAAALEVAEQNADGDDLEADPEDEERLPARDVPYLEAEVLAEEPCQPAEREEDRGDDRQLLDDVVEPVRGRREVDVHRARQQVAVGVDQVADP